MIERTFDYRKVKKMAPWPPVISSEVIYLLDDDVGLWTFHNYLDGLMIHAEMTPQCRGESAMLSAKASFDWIFQNTNKTIIYAGIPIEKKPACYMAIWSGMTYTHTEDNKRYYNMIKKVTEDGFR